MQLLTFKTKIYMYRIFFIYMYHNSLTRAFKNMIFLTKFVNVKLLTSFSHENFMVTLSTIQKSKHLILYKN